MSSAFIEHLARIALLAPRLGQFRESQLSRRLLCALPRGGRDAHPTGQLQGTVTQQFRIKMASTDSEIHEREFIMIDAMPLFSSPDQIEPGD
jgi:hypothetical protein